jgi:hypothetical protein
MKFTNCWLDMHSLFIKQNEKHLIEPKSISSWRETRDSSCSTLAAAESYRKYRYGFGR